MRAFFAVGLTGGALSGAQDLLARLRAEPNEGVRWVRPEGLHVTLFFLGEISDAQVAPLVRSVGEEVARRAPFEMALGAVGSFPSRRRPRVVAVEVAPEAPLAELAAAVSRGAAREGFAPEERRFRAHLTLGRVKQGPPRLSELAAPAGASMPVTEVTLFRSRLDDSGARYTPLEHVALGASSTPLST